MPFPARSLLAAAVLAMALVLVSPATATVYSPEPHAARSLASEPLLPRPTDGGDFGYTAEAASFAGAKAVVHYVVTGADAPSGADEDLDGVPDYVQAVAFAADVALTEFAELGFRAPAPDAAGPNNLPDIYLMSLGGPLGFAVPHAYASGGAFVVIDTALDAGIVNPTGSLHATVAHELFHLVQFSYVDWEMPGWIAEGSAMAMEQEVFPEIIDAVSRAYMSVWLDTPWISLYDESFYCERCYGSAWWWLLLMEMDPDLMPRYFDRLAGYQFNGRALGRGLQPLNEVLKKMRYGGLYEMYSAFSLALYTERLAPGPAYRLRAKKHKVRWTDVMRVEGLSTHYVPVTVPKGASSLEVFVRAGAGPKPDVKVIIGGANGRLATPTKRAKGRITYFDVRLRNARERKNVMMVITSGRKAGVNYFVGHAAH